MVSKDTLHRELAAIFMKAGMHVPPANPQFTYVATLKHGVHANIELIRETELALGCTLKLPADYDKEFLMELLQANFCMDDAYPIIISAALDTQEIVLWSKGALARFDTPGLTDFLERFFYAANTVAKWAGTGAAHGTAHGAAPAPARNKSAFELRLREQLAIGNEER